MKKWELLITRETVLFERYLRIDGYREMFGSRSRVQVRNLLTVNRAGLTALYVYAPEARERLKVILSEYRKGNFRKLRPFWEEIIKNLEKSVNQFLKQSNSTAFPKFARDYKLGRAIVFYTEGLSKLMAKGHYPAEIIQLVGEWHERAETVTCKAWDQVKKVVVKLAKRRGVLKEDILYYLPDEFFRLLKSGKTVSERVINQRRKYYVLLMRNGRIRLYLGNAAHAIERKELPLRDVTAVHILKGMPASQGYAKGLVRIVNTEAQVRKMKNGEILVSIMTTPRLVSAVKKAAAIVTDEGGITSHAAIVARELKTPCIVGTKIATQVFKDGDRVEVDAVRGIVRKI